jgi:hypothetical protein
MFVMAIGVLGCAQGNAATPVTTVDGQATPQTSVAVEPKPLPEVSHAPSPSATGSELLTDEIRRELGLVLLPIPDGAPAAKVGQDEAVAAAGKSFGRKDEPAVVEHGLGSVSEPKHATVWLIVYPVVDASPEPAGPACPGSNQAAAQVVITLQGAMVSDQTGKILTSFDHGYEIPPESPCPSIGG